MPKKHFIDLADALRLTKPTPPLGNDYSSFVLRKKQWLFDVNTLADFCQAQNPNFNRERWLGYIAGTCGPSGGKRG